MSPQWGVGDIDNHGIDVNGSSTAQVHQLRQLPFDVTHSMSNSNMQTECPLRRSTKAIRQRQRLDL